jgi:hypothetical protein
MWERLASKFGALVEVMCGEQADLHASRTKENRSGLLLMKLRESSSSSLVLRRFFFPFTVTNGERSRYWEGNVFMRICLRTVPIQRRSIILPSSSMIKYYPSVLPK